MSHVFRLLFGISLFFTTYHQIMAETHFVDTDAVSIDKSKPNIVQDESIPAEPARCHVLNRNRYFFHFAQQLEFLPFRQSIEGNFEDLKMLPEMLDLRQVSDIQVQLKTADIIYREVLGLSPPLESERYQQAYFINVGFVKSDRAFGRAFDEVITTTALGADKCAIGMLLSSRVNADSNLTPAHELFHLYQNSVMMFKQGWLTEGLASWSEYLFKEGSKDENIPPLPKSEEELRIIMSQRYTASKMWHRLFELIDVKGEFDIPKTITNTTYLSGKPVIADNKAHGTQFIKILFAELAIESDRVADNNGWHKYEWRESDQGDAALNPHIWQAIKRAVLKSTKSDERNEELEQFLSIQLYN